MIVCDGRRMDCKVMDGLHCCNALVEYNHCDLPSSTLIRSLAGWLAGAGSSGRDGDWQLSV